MRNWIKGIIYECLREIVKHEPLIISNRPPSPDDVYGKGTIWVNGQEIWTAELVTVKWTLRGEK